MSSNTLMETLGIEFTEIGENFVICKMPVNSNVHQPAGILHGGATAALVETAGSFASRYFLEDEKLSIRGVEITTNHVKSVSNGFILAKAAIPFLTVFGISCNFKSRKILGLIEYIL